MLTYLGIDSPEYPKDVKKCLAQNAPKRIAVLGSLSILNGKTLGIFCSTKCPSGLILRTYDLALHLRESDNTVVGGFHSPMESEFLTFYQRSKQPAIICPARSIEDMRLTSERKASLEEKRLLLLSPFDEKHKRISIALAQKRNEFIAALADRVLVVYAEPGGKIEALARTAVGWGKPLLTVNEDENANLLKLGAVPISF